MARALMDHPGKQVTWRKKGFGRTVLQHVVITPTEFYRWSGVARRQDGGASGFCMLGWQSLAGGGTALLPVIAALNVEKLMQAVRRTGRLRTAYIVILTLYRCALSEDHGPQRFALLLILALNLLRSFPFLAMKYMRVRRKRAGWDDDALAELLGMTPL